MRVLHLSKLHPSSRRRLLTATGLIFISASTSAAFVGCDHSDAAKRVREIGEGNASGGDGDGDGDGGTGDGDGDGDVNLPGGIPEVDRTQGAPATEALATPFTAVTVDYTAPLVDEEGRAECGDTLVRDEYIPDPAVEEEATNLIKLMDVNQKVVQLTGIQPDYQDRNRWEDIQRSRDDENLGIKGYLWRDGPHGLNLEAGEGRDPLENYSTSFPTSVSQGATFDFELVRAVGEAMGDETQAAGQMVLLGPCMNVLRHPRWGRAQETFGEDTFHLGRIGTAISLGIQQHVAGCAKHYTANNVELERFFIDATMDEQTLRETYGRHFEMVVRDGGIACIMAAYNKVNGTKSTQNKHLLTEMLRDDMGFKGFVLTDWWAMPGGNVGQGPVDPPQDEEYALQAMEAGLNVEVPWTVNYDAIPRLIDGGKLSPSILDNAVHDVLEQKIRFNSAQMDQPIGLETPDTSYDSAAGSITGTEAHVQLAALAAEKGMVLMKNENSVLPLQGISKVAVVGATVEYYIKTDNPPTKDFNFVTDAALGDRGSSRVRPNPALVMGPLAGIEAAAADKGIEVVSAQGKADEIDVSSVADADVIIAIVGLTPEDEGEEYTGAADREELDLPAVHNQVVQDAIATGKPVIVVIESGGMINMPWHDQVAGVVMAWYPGQRGGEAMGHLFFGDANFGGRLPITWSANESDWGNFGVLNDEAKEVPHDYFVGYKMFDEKGITPLYYFGHGLSYSTFEYSRLKAPCSTVTQNGVVNVEVDVTNSSGPDGDEVVQVYVSFPDAGHRRNKKELKGFARVPIAAGETKRVTIPVRVHDLKFWNNDNDRWEITPGDYTFSVGPNSGDLKLSQTVTVVE